MQLCLDTIKINRFIKEKYSSMKLVQKEKYLNRKKIK